MPSRKKDRGKQRKAAKQNSNGLAGRASPHAQMLGIKQLKAEGCRVVTSLYGGPTTVRHPIFQHMRLSVGGRTPTAAEWRDFDRGLLSDEERRELAENYVHNYAQGMREGDYHATNVIVGNVSDPHLRQWLVDELLKADIHLSMLHFLNQSDRSVSDVLGRVVGADESIKLPSYWVGIIGLLVGLSVHAQEEARLKLARDIGPFVMTVVDDKRESFQSNVIWHVCLTPFFELIREVMVSKEALLVMISYEGFLPFVAQASCWIQSREDIVEECRMLQQQHAGVLCLEPLSKAGREAQRLIAWIIRQNDDGVVMRGVLNQIACTPLLSDDPNCKDSTMAGLVRMLDKSSERDFLFECVIEPLLLKHDYIDAQVIVELIEYGKGNQSMAAAETVLSLMVAILGQDNDCDHIKMIDSRYAAAVRYGLLEFCIGALVAYGNENDCKIAGFGIAEWIYCISHGLRSMAMHSRTSRALRERKEGITTALYSLWKKFGSSQFDKICGLIGSSIDMSAPVTCCNCLKEVDRNELLYCKRCGVECYCSLACQSESYGLGHDVLCKKEAHRSCELKEKGLRETELKRMTVLSNNLMVNGCRLVQSRAAEVLNEEWDSTEVTVDFGDYPLDMAVSRDETGECSGPDCLKFTFTAPVYYGFVEKVDQEEVAVEKFISRRWLAQHQIIEYDDVD